MKPTGTSSKFANMTEQALREFEAEYGVKFDKITKVPLEGDGTIERRVERWVLPPAPNFVFISRLTDMSPDSPLHLIKTPRLYANLKANPEWISDLHNADAIIVATHSQGSIVSTHLLDRLVRDGHIVTSRNQDQDQNQQKLMMPVGLGVGPVEMFPSSMGVGVEGERRRKVQRVCCLALCGIHLGPLRYLGSSTLVGPYLQVCGIVVLFCFSVVLKDLFDSILILVFRVHGCERAVRVSEYGKCGVKGVCGGAAECS